MAKQSTSRDGPPLTRFSMRSATSPSDDLRSPAQPSSRGRSLLRRRSSLVKPVTSLINRSAGESVKPAGIRSPVPSQFSSFKGDIGLRLSASGITSRTYTSPQWLMVAGHGEAGAARVEDSEQVQAGLGSPVSLLDTLADEGAGRESARRLRPLTGDRQESSVPPVLSLTGKPSSFASEPAGGFFATSRAGPVAPGVAQAELGRADGDTTVLHRVRRLASRARRLIFREPAGPSKSGAFETRPPEGSGASKVSATGPTALIKPEQGGFMAPGPRGRSESGPVPWDSFIPQRGRLDVGTGLGLPLPRVTIEGSSVVSNLPGAIRRLGPGGVDDPAPSIFSRLGGSLSRLVIHRSAQGRPAPNHVAAAELGTPMRSAERVLIQRRQSLARPPQELLRQSNKPVGMELAMAPTGRREFNLTAADAPGLRTAGPIGPSGPKGKNHGQPPVIARYPAAAPAPAEGFGSTVFKAEAPAPSPSNSGSTTGAGEAGTQIEKQFEAWEIEFLASKVYSYLKNRLAVEKERHGHPGFALWR